jgi:hypothetical protein
LGNGRASIPPKAGRAGRKCGSARSSPDAPPVSGPNSA